MADEIARLGVVVDSTPAVTASKDLDALATSGDRATASTRNLSQSWEGARFSNAKLFSINKGVRDWRASMESARDAAGQLDSTWQSQTFSSAKVLSVRQSVQNFRESLQQARAAANELDQSWKKNTFSDRQLYSVNQSLARYRESLRQTRADAAALAPAQKIVAESHHQVAKAAAGYTKTAKELAFANRNLPAQFTDIAVSLQAGQNPMTVLLQQGGQLKDMYGGIGPAIGAMTKYVVGLINPLTLAATATVALAVAWKQGESEAVAFERAIAQAGARIGVTSEQLVTMSQNMETARVTQGAAAAALAEVASSGKVAGTSLEMVATAALNMQRATGRAIKDTVAEFVELGKEPVAAAAKLNEEYGFLTQTIYEQIKALENQGRTAEAAALAQSAYATEVNRRSKEMIESLGLLEKGFHYLKIGAQDAWDAVRDIGRQSTGAEEFNKLHQELQRALDISAAYGAAGADTPEWLQKRIDGHKAAMKALSDANVRDTKEAGRRRLAQEAADYAIQLDREAALYESNAEKRLRMTTKQNEQFRQAVLREERVGGADLADRIARLREDHNKVIAGIEERYKDPKTPKSKAESEAERALKAQAREYENLNKTLDQHEATLRAAGEAQDKLTTFERWAVKTLSDLSGEHSLLNEKQREEIRQRIESARVLDAENTERERQAKAMAVVADLTGRLNKAEADQKFSMNREIRSIGMGSEQAALANAMEDISKRATEERIALAERMGELNSENTAEYLEGLRQINEAEQRMLDNELDHWDRRKAAMSDWRNGARAAMDEIEMASWDVAGQTKDAYLTAFSAMNNALNNFAETGKLKIRDFATVVIAELTRIAITIALSKALTSMFGGYSSDPSAGVGSAYGGNVFAANRGAVVSNGYLTSMARGGVRTSPTLLPMANGGRVLMAEQAPEAIMPLDRDANGRLGVRSVGGGGGTTFNINTNVIVNQDGTTNSSVATDGDSDAAADGKKIAAALESKIREVLVQENRQGGILWAMRNRG